MLFTPFGLFPLIKGSLLILSIITVLLCSLFLSLYKQRNLAVLCLASPVVSILFFWIASGQSIFNLPAYVSNTILLASGFTEAMAIEGDNKELIFLGLPLLAFSYQYSCKNSSHHYPKHFYFVSISFFFSSHIKRVSQDILAMPSLLVPLFC